MDSSPQPCVLSPLPNYTTITYYNYVSDTAQGTKGVLLLFLKSFYHFDLKSAHCQNTYIHTYTHTIVLGGLID